MRKALITAVFLATTVVPAWADRKTECEDMSNPQRAIEVCTDIINRPNAPGDKFVEGAVATAYDNRGVAKNKLGMYQEAINDYSESLKLNPSRLVHFNRGITYIRMGNYAYALQDADLGLKAPADPDEEKAAPLTFVGAKPIMETALIFLRALALEGVGRKTEALEEFQTAYMYSGYHSGSSLMADARKISEQHIIALGGQPRFFGTNLGSFGVQSSAPTIPPPSSPNSNLPLGAIIVPKSQLPPDVHIVPHLPPDPATQKSWEQFDKQQRDGTLNGPPSTVPLSKSDQDTIDAARKLQCAMNPKLC